MQLSTSLDSDRISSLATSLIERLRIASKPLGDRVGELLDYALSYLLLGGFYAQVEPSQRTVSNFDYVIRGGGVIQDGEVYPYRGPDFGHYPDTSTLFDVLVSLDVAEEDGLMEDLYALACKLFKPEEAAAHSAAS
jgi:hypothetical protein